MPKTKTPPTVRDLRIFALIIWVGFFIIGYLIPFYKGQAPHQVLLVIAFFILAMGILTPKYLIRPREYWIVVGNVLGKINSTILFTVVYFVIFSTIGLIFKIMKRDRLFTKFRSVSSTLVLKKDISAFTDPF